MWDLRTARFLLWEWDRATRFVGDAVRLQVTDHVRQWHFPCCRDFELHCCKTT